MAPGVCVTSFRMLLRHMDIKSHLNRRRGLRLMPVATTLTLNSWHISRRGYADTSGEPYLKDLNAGKKAIKCNNEAAAGAGRFHENLKGPSGVYLNQHPQQHSPHHRYYSSSSSQPPTPPPPPLPPLASSDKNNKTQLKDNAEASVSARLDPSSHAPLEQMKVAELKAQMRAVGLSVNGNKRTLIRRLRDHQREQDAQEPVPAGGQQQQQPVLRGEREAPSLQEIATKPETLNTTSKGSTANPSQFRVNPQDTSRTHIATAVDTDKDINTDTHDGNVVHAVAHQAVMFQNDLPSSSVGSCHSNDDNDVFVEYIQGLPHLTVPLPSRNEKCRFALMPVSHKVGDLIDMLKEEDRGIDRATILNKCGVRIASTCNIESLMDETFWIQINDNKYKVDPPRRLKVRTEDLNRVGDVRSLVAQLYEALHVNEYQVKKETELASRLEHLKFQVTPYEQMKAELSNRAERRNTFFTWFGLGLMSVQFGILARLTWWEYSWDIMEPVTYFVTYGTTIAFYAYYCVTKVEYSFNDVKNREYLLFMHKNAKKKQFDIEKYNMLKREIADIEYDLRRLRDPLNVQMAPAVYRSVGEPGAPPTVPPPQTEKEPDASHKAAGPFKLPFL